MPRYLLTICLLVCCLSPVMAVVHVDCNAPGPVHDGTTWATAFKTIQSALDSLNDTATIWVRKGVYRERVVVNRFVNLYGGFLGCETSLNQRLVGVYPTVIDAQKKGRCLDVTRGQYVVIDGFTMRYGKSDMGGGLRLFNDARYTVSNCRFEFCEATTYGGGLYSAPYAQGDITNCIMARNTCPKGGGAFIEYHSYPAVRNCQFIRNRATWGGGIYCPYHAGPDLENCNVLYNTADASGGGVWCAYGAPVKLNYTIIAFNSAPVGGGIYGGGTSSALTYSHTDLFGNAGGDTGGVLNPPPAWEGNFSMDPLFVMPENDEFNLQATSPCAGVGAYPLEPACGFDRIGFAKLQPDGTPIKFTGKLVSGIDGDTTYIQDPDRASAIAVRGLSGYQAGHLLASITGILSTDPSGHRVLASPSAARHFGACSGLTPVTAVTRDLGSMVGLCVRVSGPVTAVSPDGFTLNDGWADLTVKYAGTSVHIGDYALVTGVPTIAGHLSASQVTLR